MHISDIIFLEFVSIVQQTSASTVKKATLTSGPKITVTVNDSAKVPKKRPAKLTLSERFASETVSPPKISHISMEESEATNKGTVTKTNLSTKKLTLSDKGKNNACLYGMTSHCQIDAPTGKKCTFDVF